MPLQQLQSTPAQRAAPYKLNGLKLWLVETH
jgi:hypothetical protein